jgi:hypothetical protein
MNVGFGGGSDTYEVERAGGITGAANSHNGARVQRRGREHVVMRWGRCTGGVVGADADNQFVRSK